MLDELVDSLLNIFSIEHFMHLRNVVLRYVCSGECWENVCVSYKFRRGYNINSVVLVRVDSGSKMLVDVLAFEVFDQCLVSSGDHFHDFGSLFLVFVGVMHFILLAFLPGWT